jgi:hypothetical protein
VFSPQKENTMRSPVTAAALCAASLFLAPGARAQDVPQPVAHTVLEPPSQPPPPPAPVQPLPAQPVPVQAMPLPAQPVPVAPAIAAAPAAPRSEIGFTLRMGAADKDRMLLGGSFSGSSGPATVGLSADWAVDVGGTGEHQHDSSGSWHWCEVQPDGRCISRTDLMVSGYAGLRLKTGSPASGLRLKLELVGELGWGWTYVAERSSLDVWSDALRAYPFAGVRGQVGLIVFKNATFGMGGYVRQSLTGETCVTTAGGCTTVGGPTAGVYIFGGGDWGIGG